MAKKLRGDLEAWRKLLHDRGIRRTWHFTPLVCVPSILYHGRILSIQCLESLGIKAPQRASRDDDLSKGVGNVVKISVLPYWRMLGTSMRQGTPEAMFELTTQPILWEDTYFGNSNVWENCWITGNSYEFAAEKVFVPRSKWDGFSPPEIYVEEELPIPANLVKIHTILDDERAELAKAIERLGLGNFDVFTAGFSFPFPSAAREDYLKNRSSKFPAVQQYLQEVSSQGLITGVGID